MFYACLVSGILLCFSFDKAGSKTALFDLLSMKKKEIVLHSKHHDRRFGVDIRYKENKNSCPVIIFVHGFKGFKDWGTFDLVADYFAGKNYVFVKLNLSHNGTTPEAPTEFADLEAFGSNNFTIEMDDLGVLIDYLHENPVPQADLSRIALVGHSRGGALVLLKTSEDKRIKAVATWAAVSDLRKMFPEHQIPEWKEKGVHYIYNSRTGQNMPLYYQLCEDFMANAERFDVATAVRNLHQPMIAFHGTADQTLIVEMAYHLKQWNPDAELVIMKNADHTFGSYHPYNRAVLPADMQQVVGKTHDFFKDHL